jgi:spermidine synthase
MSSGLWFTEQQPGDDIRLSFATDEVLFRGVSPFQSVDVIRTKAFGKMLLLDGAVMITEDDEFVYHEMIAHIPACLHEDPKRVVVIGGGDGGTVRELLKHKSIEEIVLCEIDEMVVNACKEHFPKVASGLADPRVKVRIGDGIAYMKELDRSVDIAIIDSTDPVGPGEGLFTPDFYRSVARALRPGGIMVAQSESPWFDAELMSRIHRNIGAGFSTKHTFVGSIPTYPRGLWSWTLGANHALDPAKDFDMGRMRAVEGGLEYLTASRAVAAFDLPPFFKRKLQGLNLSR